MHVTQLFLCLLMGIFLNVSHISADENNETTSSEGKITRIPLKKAGIYNRVGTDSQISQENIAYSASQPYINYQAAIDEDEEYQQAVQAAGLRNAMETPSYNVKAAFPYNFNNYDNNNNNAMLSSVYVSQASNSAPIRQNDLQKTLDSKSVSTGGFQNQGVQFNNDLGQSQGFDSKFTSNFPQGNNFATYPQTSTFTVSNVNDNFPQTSSSNFNRNQGLQQSVTEINTQVRNNNNNNNNNNNFNDMNGQKQTVFKITTSNQLPLATTMANLAPFLSNGFSGNIIATLPQGMMQHAFVPAVAFAPQMGFGGMNFLKPHGNKQVSLNKIAMGSNMANTIQNNPGIIAPNTLTVPMFYGNIGANRLSSPHPAFSPVMYPGPMFFPAFTPYGHHFRGHPGNKGNGSNSSNRNKSRSENRDDRDDAEDLFEDDPVDLDSDE